MPLVVMTAGDPSPFASPLGVWMRETGDYWIHTRRWTVARVAQGLGLSPASVLELLAGRIWCVLCGDTADLDPGTNPVLCAGCVACLRGLNQDFTDGE